MLLRYRLSDIDAAARQFWQDFPSQTVFGFHGGLGAGKTTFIHALCKAKGVTGSMGSPTFSIINEYFAAVEINVIDSDVDQLAHSHRCIEHEFEHKLALSIAALLHRLEELLELAQRQ